MYIAKHHLDALAWIELNLEWWLKHGAGAPNGVVLVARALSETDDGEAIRDEVEEWKNKANLRGVEYNAALARAEKAEAELATVKAERDQWEQTAGQFGATASEFMGRYNAKATEIMKNECDACKEMVHARAEKLERDLAAVVRERDEARESVRVGLPLIHELKERAEKAERERDEARRDHCAAAAKVENHTADGRRQPYTARDIAREVYQDAADSLFPKEVKPCG